MSVSPEAYMMMQAGNSQQQDANQQAAVSLRDLILPIVAGAIAGISPKAAQAVDIASGLYSNIQRVKQMRDADTAQMRMKAAKAQLDMEARRRLDKAVEHLLSTDSTPATATAHLLAAGIPARDISDIIARRYGLTPEEASAKIQSLPMGTGAEIPLTFGGTVSRNVSTQIGNPVVKQVYNPTTGETSDIIIYQEPGKPPQTIVQPRKGVPAEAADQVLRAQTQQARAVTPSYKLVLGIDPETGQEKFFNYNIRTGQLTLADAVAPQPGPGVPGSVRTAREISNILKNLWAVYDSAIQSGDENLAKQALELIQSYQAQLPTVAPGQAAGGSSVGGKTPEQEAREYLLKRQRRSSKPSER